jgi:N-acetylglucosaminyldiphosphoundecaprenol N-acetyl-beta-D-mannosaminyltransferase
MKKNRIISLDISSSPYIDFIENIAELASEKVSSYVCVSNVHMTIEAWHESEFARVVNGADIATPDGMPLVKSLKLLYGIDQERVAGMDLLPDMIAEAEKNDLSIYFYGSTDDVLQKITERINTEHHAVKIAGVCSPPFRQLSEQEEAEIVERINASGANMVMVALGCPKQELWMARHKGKINAVMLGVGGAFPVYAGVQKRAPQWMQKFSLEWLYRLCQEPRRLCKRYFVTNSLFLMLIARQIVAVKIGNIMRKAKVQKP